MGRKILCKIFLIIMFLIILGGCRPQAKLEEPKSVTVEVMIVEKKEIEEVVTLRGQLKPKDEILVFTKTPGLKVTKLSVELGEYVKEGTLLFELDKTLVRKQVEQAKMNYDLARENYSKQKQLLQNNPLESDQETTVFKNIGKVPAQYQSIMNQELENPKSNREAMEASLKGVSLQLEQARMAYINVLEQLGEMEYFAPMSGVVSQLSIQENQMILNNVPAIVLSNTEELKVELSVSASLLQDIRKEDPVIIVIEQQEVQGIVTIINPIGDVRNNLHTVEILVNNSEKKFISGGFVYVNILRGMKNDVLVIPKDAMVSQGKDDYVFIERSGKAQRQRVESGINAGNEIEIIRGLEAGDRVIIKGQHFIEDATPVVVRGEKNEDH